MARMEFLRRNHITTTTMIKVDSGTALTAYIFDRNPRFGWSSSGYTGATKTTISIEFDSPTVLSHLLVQSHNMRDYRVFYNSVTANSLAIVAGNSQTSMYLSFNSITVSSIQLQIDQVMAGAGERTFGELIVTERKLVFERNPSFQQWRENIYRKQVEHEMPDGGSVVFNIKDKYRTGLSWEFITEDFRDSLRDIFDEAQPVHFLPRPTTSSWDGIAPECNWVGGFDFTYADNAPSVGFSGSMSLKETPSG